MVVIHIDGKLGKFVFDVDKFAEHQLWVVHDFRCQAGRRVDSFGTDGAAAVVRLGKARENQFFAVVNFGRAYAVAGKQVGGFPFVAALRDEVRIGNDDVDTCRFETFAFVCQLLQFGVYGGDDQTDVFAYRQIENAVDIRIVIDQRYFKRTVGNMAGGRHARHQIRRQNLDVV